MRRQRSHHRSADPFHFAVYAFWALLAMICWVSAVSCAKPEKTTTVIREAAPPPENPPGVNVKIQDGKDGGVEVDVHGKVENK